MSIDDCFKKTKTGFKVEGEITLPARDVRALQAITERDYVMSTNLNGLHLEGDSEGTSYALIWREAQEGERNVYRESARLNVRNQSGGAFKTYTKLPLVTLTVTYVPTMTTSTRKDTAVQITLNGTGFGEMSAKDKAQVASAVYDGIQKTVSLGNGLTGKGFILPDLTQEAKYAGEVAKPPYKGKPPAQEARP